MRKILPILLCLLILCGCKVNDFMVYNYSSSLTTSSITTANPSSQNSSNKPLNINTKIYAAKNTTTYSKDLLYPKTIQNSVSEDSYFYYSALSNKIKKLYKALCRSIECMADGFIDLDYISDDDISFLITSIKNDRPEYFWLGQDYIINTKKDGFKQIAFQFKSEDYSIKYLYTPENRNKIFSSIKCILSKLENEIQNMNEFEKELYIHDFLINNCNYDKIALYDINNHRDAYNVYGALVQKKAVCEGYAKALQLLNNHFGIKTTVITGKADGQNHMWNLVLIDGNYFHLDSTFNDNEITNLYSYFNLSDTAIKRTHKPDYSFYSNFKLPKAESTEKSYFTVNGSMIYDNPLDDIKNAIDYAISNKKTSIDFGYYDHATNFYKNNDEFLHDDINIPKIINLACKKNNVKVKNIKLFFATNYNFKITWEYVK